MSTTVGQVSVVLIAKTQKFARGMADAAKRLGRVKIKAVTLNRALVGLGTAFGAIQLAKFGARMIRHVLRPMRLVITEAIKMSAMFEELAVSFEVLGGSKSIGKKLMDDLIDFSKFTPFRLQEVARAAKKLLAFGIDPEQIVPHLKVIGNLVSALGVPLGDVAWLVGQTRVEWRLLSRDMRQFSQRGIPLIEELAKQFGVTTGEILRMGSAGKIAFPDLQRALNAMTGEQGRFHDMIARTAVILKGLWSTLRDTIDLTLKSIGDRIREATGLDEFFDRLLGGLQQNKEKIAIFVANLFVGALRLAGIAINWLASRLGELAKVFLVVVRAMGKFGIARELVNQETKLLGAILTQTYIKWELEASKFMDRMFHKIKLFFIGVRGLVSDFVLPQLKAFTDAVEGSAAAFLFPGLRQATDALEEAFGFKQGDMTPLNAPTSLATERLTEELSKAGKAVVDIRDLVDKLLVGVNPSRPHPGDSKFVLALTEAIKQLDAFRAAHVDVEGGIVGAARELIEAFAKASKGAKAFLDSILAPKIEAGRGGAGGAAQGIKFPGAFLRGSLEAIKAEFLFRGDTRARTFQERTSVYQGKVIDWYSKFDFRLEGLLAQSRAKDPIRVFAIV